MLIKIDVTFYQMNLKFVKFLSELEKNIGTSGGIQNKNTEVG